MMKASMVKNNQELYLWLKTHNPKLAEKFITRKLDKATYDQLIVQLNRQKKAEEVHTLIDFSLPEQDVTDNELRKEFVELNQSSRAVHNVLKIKQNKDRYNAGLSLSTLMTEHKRKVLLNALTDQMQLENESRDLSRKKMETYLLTHEDTPSIHSDDTSVAPPPQMDTTINTGKGDSNSRPTAKPAMLSVDGEVAVHRFEPKWSDYQVMQSRWLTIQPQTKKLI